MANLQPEGPCDRRAAPGAGACGSQVVSSGGLQQRSVKPPHRRHVVRLDTGELRLKCFHEYWHLTDAADHDEDSCICHGIEKSINHV